jgi:hypothetical protein
MIGIFISLLYVSFVLLTLCPQSAQSWRKWTWDHVDSGNVDGNGNMIPKPGPVGRRGHTLNLVADDIVVLFGGRGPEKL